MRKIRQAKEVRRRSVPVSVELVFSGITGGGAQSGVEEFPFCEIVKRLSMYHPRLSLSIP